MKRVLVYVSLILGVFTPAGVASHHGSGVDVNDTLAGETRPGETGEESSEESSTEERKRSSSSSHPSSINIGHLHAISDFIRHTRQAVIAHHAAHALDKEMAALTSNVITPSQATSDHTTPAPPDQQAPAQPEQQTPAQPEQRATDQQAPAQPAEAPKTPAQPEQKATDQQVPAQPAPKAQPAAPATKAPTVQSMAVKQMWTTGSVNIRSGPGTSHARVGSLAGGTKVQVNGKADGFYRLTDGRFVSGAYLTSTQPAPKPAPAKPQAAPAPAKTTTQQAPQSKVSTPQPAAQKYAWTTYVSNSGGQAAVDACTGGLTRFTAGSIPGKSYYPIHRHCGGAPILGLSSGQLIEIKSVGVFRVVDSRLVVKGATSTSLNGMKGTVLVQTCLPNSNQMRVVGLVPA